MPGAQRLTIRRFTPADQSGARECVLAGLAEHFPDFRPEMNPDLDDIATTYADGVFLVATLGEAIVGTGAIQPQPDGTANVVRMSTLRERRRSGVARAMFDALAQEARTAGCHRITLATLGVWDDATGFYRAIGMRELMRTNGGIVFELPLDPG